MHAHTLLAAHSKENIEALLMAAMCTFVCVTDSLRTEEHAGRLPATAAQWRQREGKMKKKYGFIFGACQHDLSPKHQKK